MHTGTSLDLGLQYTPKGAKYFRVYDIEREKNVSIHIDP